MRSCERGLDGVGELANRFADVWESGDRDLRRCSNSNPWSEIARYFPSCLVPPTLSLSQELSQRDSQLLPPPSLLSPSSPPTTFDIGPSNVRKPWTVPLSDGSSHLDPAVLATQNARHSICCRSAGNDVAAPTSRSVSGTLGRHRWEHCSQVSRMTGQGGRLRWGDRRLV